MPNMMTHFVKKQQEINMPKVGLRFILLGTTTQGVVGACRKDLQRAPTVFELLRTVASELYTSSEHRLQHLSVYGI